jgi:hypothetical protein
MSDGSFSSSHHSKSNLFDDFWHHLMSGYFTRKSMEQLVFKILGEQLLVYIWPHKKEENTSKKQKS